MIFFEIYVLIFYIDYAKIKQALRTARLFSPKGGGAVEYIAIIVIFTFYIVLLIRNRR